MDYCYQINSLPSGIYQIHGQGQDENLNGEIVILKEGMVNYTGGAVLQEPFSSFQEKTSPYCMLQKIL